jgi:pimeloyl-ACP methyl ester carboxylesterase
MRMIDVGGNVLRVLDVGDADGLAPIVLAADAPVVLEHLVPLVDTLRVRRRVVALEMPGFGFSRPTSAYRFTLHEQVDVLLGLLDALDAGRAHLAFTCINAFIAAALSKRAPERVERLTLGQMPSLHEFRHWAARIDLRVAGIPLLATPGVGQALMAAAPSFIAGKWFHGVSGPKANPEAFARVAGTVYEDGGTFCLAALNQSMNEPTSAPSKSPRPSFGAPPIAPIVPRGARPAARSRHTPTCIPSTISVTVSTSKTPSASRPSSSTSRLDGDLPQRNRARRRALRSVRARRCSIAIRSVTPGIWRGKVRARISV